MRVRTTLNEASALENACVIISAFVGREYKECVRIWFGPDQLIKTKTQADKIAQDVRVSLGARFI